MRAVLIVLLLLGSLAWIAYSGFSLIEKEKFSYHPEFVFNDQDSVVLVVNRWSEIEDAAQLLPAKNPYLHLQITPPYTQFKYYFSANRPFFIAQKKGKWNPEELKDFADQLNLHPSEIKYNNGDYLLVAKKDIQLNEEKLSFIGLNDKNASASTVDFTTGANTDIYKTQQGNYQYKSKLAHEAFGSAVDDQLNFAYLVPEEVEDYTFYQYAYLQHHDSVYAKGLMAEWVDKGIVKGELKGQTFIISDYSAQQNPILILLEKSDKVDTNYLENEVKHFEGFQLTSDFPKKGKAIYVLEVEDKVVLAESEALCKQIALHYKLGKTLALNVSKQNRIYGDLTREVHYRKVEDKRATSISYSELQSFKVDKIEGEIRPSDRDQRSKVRTIAVGKAMQNILPIWDHIRGAYSYFVSAKDGAYFLFSSEGKRIWDGKIEGEIKDVQVVDVYQNKKHQIAFTTEQSFHILDLNGNNVSGFPVNFEQALTANFAAVSWRGESKYIFGTHVGEVIMLNAKGMELIIQKTAQQAIIGEIHGLNRKGTLSAWVRTEEQAYCVELEKSKLKNKVANFSPLQLKSGGDVIAVLNQNEKQELLNIAGEVVGSVDGNKFWKDANYFYGLKDGVIIVYSAYGDALTRLNKSNQEVTQIHTLEVQGRYYTLILDQLENNIYLFNNEGELVKDWPKEGEGLLSFVYNKATQELLVLSQVEQNLIIYSTSINA
ncbi:hypothetical protein SAMN05216474_3000 [Lishizhenia tianjinensis]|uniref:Uncharacterized protein n=1 Tax=Lishizhenia tianjinensis TaxID=477690 RepID=A0A1I7BQJ8_9FLAO|nr:hypothetical protein [Lishizhenia tianjinensis]SFT89455.1 hypothetical protein SAMN05216474_3000 [Lishizhenia tianjinensis]